MWLVLCDADDEPAKWAYRGLKSRGLAPLELITTNDMDQGVSWEHHVGREGASVAFTLADGREIHSRTVRGVLNRLRWAPVKNLIYTRPEEREYATQELLAFFTSWLHCLPKPVLNKPSPHGLSGRWRHVSEWIWLASKAGLPTPEYRQSSRDLASEFLFSDSIASGEGTGTVEAIVLNRRVFCVETPPSLREGCLRLSEVSGTTIIGIEFANSSEDSWTLAGVTTMPDLRQGGEELLDWLTQSFMKWREGFG